PFGQGSEAMRATYASFETQALACLETVSLVSTPATVTGSQLSWDVIRRAVLAPTWPAWLADLPDFVKPQFRRINQLVAMRIGGAPTDAATAKEALLAASRVL